MRIKQLAPSIDRQRLVMQSMILFRKNILFRPHDRSPSGCQCTSKGYKALQPVRGLYTLLHLLKWVSSVPRRGYNMSSCAQLHCQL